MAEALSRPSAAVRQDVAAAPRDYFSLLKPRVMSLVVFTAATGLLCAGAPIHPCIGGIAILGLYLQGSGFVRVPSQVLAMLPYLATIAVLTLISSGSRRARLGAPACLG